MFDHVSVSYSGYCIKVVDYEIKLFHAECMRNGVYDYPDTTDYRWHRDKIDTVTDNYYTHLNSTGIDSVDVYVLDTGIFSTHYEFSKLKSFTLLDPTFNISQVVVGHGTHVAGIIVGRTTGLANHALFDYPVCRGVSAACYSSYIEDAFSVILARAKATKRRGVINMSFGSSISSDTPLYYQDWMNNTLASLVSNGIIPIAASGNSGTNACNSWPASSSFTLGVGAYDSSYKVPSWSNYGPCVDIYAPGMDIVSSWIGSNYTYRFASGTSMATPMVSAIVADMLWYNSSLSYNEIISKLQTSTNNIALSSCPSASTTLCKGIKINCPTLYSGKITKAPTLAPTPSTTSVSTTKKPTKSPTTCRAKGISCATYGECCSKKCLRRTCQ